MAEAGKKPHGGERPEKSARLCVNCGRPRDPHYDPFCSKRCADVDLHRWLKGCYVIPGAEPPSGEDEES
jgi:endogenous inhibitor of DNA gyrase (YacG/DUF329 family)